MAKRIFAFLLLISINLAAFSQQTTQNLPSIEPLFLEQEVTGVAENPAQTLTADEVFKLSLMFSECQLDSEEGQLCLEQFEGLKKKVSGADFMNLDFADRGRAVLKLLYQDYLKTYNFSQTKINVALQSGVYNCVSSALL